MIYIVFIQDIHYHLIRCIPLKMFKACFKYNLYRSCKQRQSLIPSEYAASLRRLRFTGNILRISSDIYATRNLKWSELVENEARKTASNLS